MNKKSKLVEVLLLNLGVLILSIGVYFFKIPNGFTTGGISGISLIISAIIGNVTPSWLIFIFNTLLLLVGFTIFGRKFGIKTTYCSVMFSVEIILLEKIYPMTAPLTDQPFLELAFAILLPAVGSAIMFNYSASSGGTDVIAMIFKKYAALNIGIALLITDFIVALSAFFIFGLKTGLFSLLGLICRAFLIDSVIESINLNKFFTIITTYPEQINSYILREIHHGVTVVDAVGAFTDTKKKMLITVVRRHQSVKLKNKIREIDPDSFVMITNSSEIIGRGFRGI
ncbi:MAG: hypothetical protein A2Y15_06725 [Clostridiales bacterium GWF2_36_10]|nr:MAG: hypothetical protein A2Y15_06725 [Clostridiales bacterium GWF2_36_10]HAN21220.1 YitT family protein [Clostridiales bacterium]